MICSFMRLATLQFETKLPRCIRMGITIFKFSFREVYCLIYVRKPLFTAPFDRQCKTKFPIVYPMIYLSKWKFWIQLSPNSKQARDYMLCKREGGKERENFCPNKIKLWHWHVDLRYILQKFHKQPKFLHIRVLSKGNNSIWEERGGPLVDRLTGDWGVMGLSLTDGTALCTCKRHFILCWILVQPRKDHPDITEKLLTGT